MFRIYDGREFFYQWDLDRKLIVEDNTINKVYFCNKTGSCSISRCVYEVNGMRLVDVPNMILQDSFRMFVYGYDVNYTKFDKVFEIKARSKPEDYIYTDVEVNTWEELEQRVEEIERNGVSQEAIDSAVNAYLKENPIEAGATQEEAAQIEQNRLDIIELQNKEVDLTGYATEDYVSGAVSNAEERIDFKLGSYALATDLDNYYNKDQTDAAIDVAIAGIEIGDIDLSDYAKKTDIPTVPTNVSAFTNDAGYLTAHQDLSAYALKSEIPDVSGYQTEEQVNALISEALGVIENGTY